MTLEEKKISLPKIKCPRCDTLNPVDTVRCIHCTATIWRSTGHIIESYNEEAKPGAKAVDV